MTPDVWQEEERGRVRYFRRLRGEIREITEREAEELRLAQYGLSMPETLERIEALEARIRELERRLGLK